MNHIQRQMIKEAYQEGYYQALHEESIRKRIGDFFGKKIGGFLGKLFRSKKVDDVVDDVVDDTVYVQSQPAQFDVDNLEGEIPDLTDLMKDKYGIDQFGNIDPDIANKAIRKTLGDPGMKERAKDRLRDTLIQQRLQDYSDIMGIDINDIPPDIVDDITRDLDDIDLDDLLGGG